MKCTVCSHPHRREIDLALVRHTPLRDVARRYDLSRSALGRHVQGHIPVEVAREQREQEHARQEDEAREVGDELSRLQAETDRILEEAKELGQLRVALAAIREARYLLDLQMRASEWEELEERVAELEERSA